MLKEWESAHRNFHMQAEASLGFAHSKKPPIYSPNKANSSAPTLHSDIKSLPRLQLSRPPDTSGAPTQVTDAKPEHYISTPRRPPHYGKFINDKWNKLANNCEFRWNPATGRVEVSALRDILLNEEFGSDNDALFWYQRHNGLSTLAQAMQVQTYYQQRKLPWYSNKSLPKTPAASQPARPLQFPAHSQPNHLSLLLLHPRTPLPHLHSQETHQTGTSHPKGTARTAKQCMETTWT